MNAHAAQVDARHKISRIVLLYQIGEGQVRCIGVVDVAPHPENAPTLAGHRI